MKRLSKNTWTDGKRTYEGPPGGPFVPMTSPTATVEAEAEVISNEGMMGEAGCECEDCACDPCECE